MNPLYLRFPNQPLFDEIQLKGCPTLIVGKMVDVSVNTLEEANDIITHIIPFITKGTADLLKVHLPEKIVLVKPYDGYQVLFEALPNNSLN
jgi:hypothetical protein